MTMCNEIFIVYVMSTTLLFFFVLYPYFAIVRRTVTFCPRSALRCLPSSLFAAELITNDKVVEIFPLAGFKQDNYLPGVGRSRQCSYHIVERQLLKTEDVLSRYDICTTVLPSCEKYSFDKVRA